MKKHVDKIYCTNCSNNLHNEYEYLGDGKVKLLKRRCKGEVFDQFLGKKDTGDVIKCECNCQTHYLYKGHPVPIGQTPKKIDELLESRNLKPIPPEINNMLQKWQKKREQPIQLKSNKFLGKVGFDESEQIKDEDENVAGGYIFKDNLKNLGRKKS